MHTIRGKTKLVARVRRIRGQLEAVERALHDDLGCASVLQQVAAARGAMNGLVSELIADHVRMHVLGGETKQRPSAAQRRAAQELIDVVHAYVK